MDDVTKIAYSGRGGKKNPEKFAYVLYGWPLTTKNK